MASSAFAKIGEITYFTYVFSNAFTFGFVGSIEDLKRGTTNDVLSNGVGYFSIL